jgi:DNA-binding transcriptional regulator YiaG
MKTIAEQLQEWRSVRGEGKGKRGAMNRRQAAEILGISWRSLEAWEQGRRTPRGLVKNLLMSILNNQPKTK